MPIVARLPSLAKALGLPYLPITANMLALGPLGLVAYFPAKFKLQVLDPVHFDVEPDRERYSPQPDHGRVRGASASRSSRRSTTCSATASRSGSADEPPRPRHRPGTFWGGRVAQALEADPNVEVIVGLDTTEPTVELERTEYVRVDANYSILARIVKATQVDTIIHTFLVVDPDARCRPGRCTRSTSSAR